MIQNRLGCGQLLDKAGVAEPPEFPAVSSNDYLELFKMSHLDVLACTLRRNLFYGGTRVNHADVMIAANGPRPSKVLRFTRSTSNVSPLRRDNELVLRPIIFIH